MASDVSLIVVTDIHGAPDEHRCLSAGQLIVERLSLANLSGRPDLTGECLHHHLFLNDGMTRAVSELCDIVSNQPPPIGLGYSAGGTALWKAVQAGACLSGLICVSSTRLRNEAPMSIPTQVFFGDNDPGRPAKEWLATVPDAATLLPNAAHAFYANAEHPARTQVASEIAATITRWTVA